MLYIILFAAVAWLIYKAFEYEKVSLFEAFVIPVYALVTFFSTMDWTLQNTIQALVIVILAFFISDYQTKDTQFKRGEDRRGRKTILIKKNRSYVVGWLAVLTLGVLFNISFAEHVDTHHLLEELLQDLKKEILIITTFTTESPWYIWLLTGLTNFMYTHRLIQERRKLLGRNQSPLQKRKLDKKLK